MVTDLPTNQLAGTVATGAGYLPYSVLPGNYGDQGGPFGSHEGGVQLLSLPVFLYFSLFSLHFTPSIPNCVCLLPKSIHGRHAI